MRRTPHRGFSLIELFTVLAIIGVLAGLSAVGLSRMKARGNFASASGDFLSAMRSARAEAFGRGDSTVVVVDTRGGRFWAIEDVNSDFALASFSDSSPAPSPDRLIASGTLPSSVSFGPANGWGQALNPPLSGIPTGYLSLADGGTADITTDGGSAAPNFKFCSFCDATTGFGSITFLPSGGALFNGGPLTIGQQIAMQDKKADAGSATGIIDFAIVGTTGAIEAVTIR